METLFGIEMSQLAGSLVVLTVIALGIIAFMASRNRVLLKLAVRNIPRRKAQSSLIIGGLMLSTTIIMAALAIGDSVSSTIRGAVFDALEDTDIRVESPVLSLFGDNYLDQAAVDRVKSTVAGDDRVDGVLPVIREPLPVLNATAGKTVAGTSVVGVHLESLSGFESLKDADGDRANLLGIRADEVLVNKALAEDLEVGIGDEVTIVTPEGRTSFAVAGIVENKGLAGGSETTRATVVMSSARLQEILDRPNQFNEIDISVVGGRDVDSEISAELAEDLKLAFINGPAADQLFTALKQPNVKAALETKVEESAGPNQFAPDTLAELVEELENETITDEFKIAATNPVTLALVGGVIEELGDLQLTQSLLLPMSQLVELEVAALKNEGLEIAELVGSLFVTIFGVFGSFSIIVGLLLIFLVFVMLAAERTGEMGIIRAVGTKRRHLVQMFTYEGILYSISAAGAGVILGLIASVALVRIMTELFSADDLITFSYGVTLQSIVVAFCAGLFLTAVTVVISAYRVSKLNIVVAIRGLGQEFVKDDVPGAGRRFKNAVRWLGGPLAYGLDTWHRIEPGRTRWPFVLGSITILAWPVLIYYSSWKPHRSPRVWIRLLVFTMWLGFVANSFIALAVAPDDVIVEQVVSQAVVVWLFMFLFKMFKFVQPWLASGVPLIPVGLLMTLAGFTEEKGIEGFSRESAFFFMMGANIFVVGVGLFIRWIMDRRGYREEVQKRVPMTFIGVVLLVWWGLPFDALDWLTGTLSGGIDMFILSGVSMVASAVWVVMHNADLIVKFINLFLGRSGRLRPVVRMAIAYPMAARFRTGLTLAMFSLVIFTLMIFAILSNIGSVIEDEPELVSGGFDIRTEISRDLPIDDPLTLIDASADLDRSDFELIASQSRLQVEARQQGVEDLSFKGARIRGVDEVWLSNNTFTLTHWDPAYGATEREIWAAIANDPSLTVVLGSMIETGDFGGGPIGFGSILSIEGIKASEPGEIEAVDLTVRPPLSQGVGKSVDVKVIGVLDQFADAFELGAADLYMNPDVISELSEVPVTAVDYKFKLADPDRAEEMTRLLETAFLEHGMTAKATTSDIEENQRQNNAFNLLFQGFMGLGLLVGVAALGVVAFRAVVERRQSIGMMRALGYTGRMVQLQFLMESGVVSILGSALGIGLGTLIGWNIFDSISQESDGVTFVIPWLNVTIIVSIAVVFSLLNTLLPARQAASITPSEALRY